MRIKPFHAIRPASGLEAQIASPPYDVVERHQARELAGNNPMSFLHITRADIDLPDDTDPQSPAVYAASAAAYRQFKQQQWLRSDAQPGLYAYRLSGKGHEQTGLAATVYAGDYDEGRIKRHEFTRPAPEEDRTRHIETLNAQTGPVLLAYREHEQIAHRIAAALSGPPLFDLHAPDGIRHTGWRIADAPALVADFATVPAAYIADGHHRIAGAARVARERRKHTTDEMRGAECEWILAVLFPASSLRILPYNRQVRDLNGMQPVDVLDRIDLHFAIEPMPDAAEPRTGHLDLYTAGRWHRLTPRQPPPDNTPVAGLDVSLLQERILGPILGIQDPRRDERLRCTGGQTPEQLALEVDRGLAAAAFSLAPVRIEQIMAVSDAHLTMPPKSTWFEPKLRSGLFVHELADV